MINVLDNVMKNDVRFYVFSYDEEFFRKNKICKKNSIFYIYFSAILITN